MTSFKLVYGKSCHLPVELEHKAYWAIKALNKDYASAGEKQIFDIQEVEELRLDAYENAKIYKDRTKKWHDKRIVRREFKEGELVLLFNSRLKLFPGKLRSRWYEPFKVIKVFQNGVVQIIDKFNEAFIVNGQRLKHYHCVENIYYYTCSQLKELIALSQNYSFHNYVKLATLNEVLCGRQPMILNLIFPRYNKRYIFMDQY